MAYVVPKDDCPHVQEVELEPDRINIGAPCNDCGDVSENWLCCTCYGVFCSRYVQGHMRLHNTASKHPIAVSFSDLSIWCYECDSYVSQATGNIVYHTHMLKHKCPPGMASVTKEEMEQVQSLVLGIGADVGFDTVLATVTEIEEEKGEKSKDKKEKGEKEKDRKEKKKTKTTTTSTSITTSPDFVPVEGLDASSYDNAVIDRILGCIYGNALGDAVGLATEFMDKEDIAKVYKNKSINFPNFVRNNHNIRWQLGDWTDDTDQLILILETLLEKQTADPILYAHKLKHWIYNGFAELGDVCGMGLGATTSRVVNDNLFLKDPIKTAFVVWDQGGRFVAPNGGVMRTSIVGCYNFTDTQQLLDNSDIFCKVTHADPRCVVSCRAVVVAVAELLKDALRSLHLHSPLSHSDLLEKIMAQVRSETHGLLEKDEHIKDFESYLTAPSLSSMKLDEPSTIGYTFKSMGSGFYGLRSEESFEETIEALAREGGDADTNGAVCGALLGCRIGYKQLPHKWLAALPNKKWLDKKVVQFLHLCGHI